jgi:hypothetical protein
MGQRDDWRAQLVMMSRVVLYSSVVSKERTLFDRWVNAQRVLYQALGALLAWERDFLSSGLGQAVAGVRLDGARGIFAGRGRYGGGGAEGRE